MGATKLFTSILKSFERHYYRRNSNLYIKYLRKIGITIGSDCEFFGTKNIEIDVTRPSLVEIGNKVIITRGVVILTHGYDWAVLRNLYGEVIGYAQPVKICDNVFIGTRAIILPGTIIGENSIIAAGSVVKGITEPNSVYAGSPAKKIMSIEKYYLKRKELYIEEAFTFARSIKRNLNRDPLPEDFNEHFPLFLERDELKFRGIPVKNQTRNTYEDFMKTKPLFQSFGDFLSQAEIG